MRADVVFMFAVAYDRTVDPGHFAAVKRESPDKIKETKPDYVCILPWNIKDEILNQLGYIREWGGQFVVFIPEVVVM